MAAGATIDEARERRDRLVRYLLAWLVGALPAFLIITLLWLYFGETEPYAYVGVAALSLAFPVIVRRLGVPRRLSFIHFLLIVGIAFSVISILTGWGNGLTDEAFTTPKFAGFTLSGHNPYTEELAFTYIQYGKSYFSESYYLYLPLLMFLQIPGISYKWFTLGCWILMVLLVRRRFDTAVLLAQPYVMLIAANGYNDLPVLLLLTVSFVGFGGRRQKWAEYLALGCKQFATAFVFVYYVFRRRWLDSAIALAVTLLFVAPFVVWGGPVVFCRAILADRIMACPSGGGASLLLNYPVWLVWAFAVFYIPLVFVLISWSRRPSVARRLERSEIDRTRWRRLPALAIVTASSVALGLTIFTSAGIALGMAGWGAIGAGAVGAAAALGWSLAWNGPWVTDPVTSGPPPGFWSTVIGRAALGEIVGAVVAIGVLAGWILLGGLPLTGAALGLSLGAVVGAGLLWRGRLLATLPWDHLPPPAPEPASRSA